MPIIYLEHEHISRIRRALECFRERSGECLLHFRETLEGINMIFTSLPYSNSGMINLELINVKNQKVDIDFDDIIRIPVVILHKITKGLVILNSNVPISYFFHISTDIITISEINEESPKIILAKDTIKTKSLVLPISIHVRIHLPGNDAIQIAKIPNVVKLEKTRISTEISIKLFNLAMKRLCLVSTPRSCISLQNTLLTFTNIGTIGKNRNYARIKSGLGRM